MGKISIASVTYENVRSDLNKNRLALLELSGFFPPVWSLSRFTAISVSFRGTGLLPLQNSALALSLSNLIYSIFTAFHTVYGVVNRDCLYLLYRRALNFQNSLQ